MAHLKRTPKLVSGWTPIQLRAFNISTTSSTFETFFGIEELPPYASSPDDTSLMLFPERFGPRFDRRAATSTSHFLSYLRLCQPSSRGSRKLDMGDFFQEVFANQLGLGGCVPGTDGDVVRYIKRRIRLSLPMCNAEVPATFNLLLQRKRSHYGRIYGRPQVLLDLVAPRRVSEPVPTPNSLPRLFGYALAAFRLLNEVRAQAGEQELESWTFLAISLQYTAPTFYKIPITAKLAEHVANGTYPTMRTVVERLEMDLPDPKGAREGFGSLQNREMLVRYCRAFKDMMNAQSLVSFEDGEAAADGDSGSVG
ncbi:hypothetical protein C8Q76DRAFT_804271 [Earliella scabrosa]|nr:hypothetical protein C8Q76DRAFT_804271 [Earliella scabrosa]